MCVCVCVKRYQSNSRIFINKKSKLHFIYIIVDNYTFVYIDIYSECVHMVSLQPLVSLSYF